MFEETIDALRNAANSLESSPYAVERFTGASPSNPLPAMLADAKQKLFLLPDSDAVVRAEVMIPALTLRMRMKWTGNHKLAPDPATIRELADLLSELATPVFSRAEDGVLDALQGGAMLKVDIEAVTELGSTAVGAALASLTERGFIRKVSPRKGWALTDKGRKTLAER